jgi:hypothetical protein
VEGGLHDVKNLLTGIDVGHLVSRPRDDLRRHLHRDHPLAPLMRSVGLDSRAWPAFRIGWIGCSSTTRPGMTGGDLEAIYITREHRSSAPMR